MGNGQRWWRWGNEAGVGERSEVAKDGKCPTSRSVVTALGVGFLV